MWVPSPRNAGIDFGSDFGQGVGVQYEESVIELAVTQGGVVTRDQVLARGMTVRQIESRLKTGRWRPTSRGVYEVFTSHRTSDVVRAAVATLPGAVAGLFTAARVHGLGRYVEGPETALVHSRTTHVYGDVMVVRCQDLLDHHVTEIDRLRVTVVSRTIVDLASRVPLGALGALVDGAISMTSTTPEQIAVTLGEVARRGRPGVTNLRGLLAERIGSRPDRSILESRGLRLLDAHGIGGYEIEYPMPWDDRRRFDVAFPDAQLAVEWDGRHWHDAADTFQTDRERDRTALVHGWRVARFTWDDVVNRPTSVAATISSLLMADS